ncbi:MAG: hypothetical protein HC788_01880 [Sphingopyxis sp.]|nr:hypothetical protein [Sphingopyxis sp.]
MAGRWAHVRIAQSAESARHWKGALIFDPFVRLDGPRPSKEPLLFATVGATLPFPRLIDWVEQAHKDGVLPSDVIVQHGGDTRPLTGMESYDSLPFKRLGEIQDKADIVVCHGGTGSIITALQRGCHVIVIPREFTRGEHYDEHQSEIAEAFAARGLIQVASSYEGFVAAFAKVNNRAAPMATTNPDALGQWLRHYIGLRRLD